jgi:hypothetical protein
MVNNHYETIRLYYITISNSPIIVGLPWLRKHNPNIDWKEGHVIFDLVRYAKEYLVTSPYPVMVAEEKAIGEYYWDTTQAMAFQDIVCSTSMLEEEEEEERLERGIEEAIAQGYIKETLSIWELCYVGLETRQQWEEEMLGGFNLQNNSNQLSPPALARDIVPSEYYDYLHIFEAKDN